MRFKRFLNPFFVFIILGVTVAELIISIGLFVSVVMIFVLFIRGAPEVQQKTFLISGMSFLLFTGFTGVLYVFRYYSAAIDSLHDYFLTMHAMVSLYGWNLTGLFIIVRWYDFPIKLNSRLLIALHWITIFVVRESI